MMQFMIQQYALNEMNLKVYWKFDFDYVVGLLIALLYLDPDNDQQTKLLIPDLYVHLLISFTSSYILDAAKAPPVYLVLGFGNHCLQSRALHIPGSYVADHSIE